MKRTLLIVGSIPGSRNVGEILLREMFECIDPERYAIAALLEEREQPASETEFPRLLRIFNRPPEHVKRRYGGRLGGLIAAWERNRTYERQIAVTAGQVETCARQLEIDRIWSIMNMTSVIDVTGRLVERMKVPLLAHVWDDVEHLVRQRKLDALTRRRTGGRFARLLNRAEKTAVICEKMGEEYARRYQARCQVVRYGIADRVVPRSEPTSGSEFRIGFSGGMYAPSAWKCLLQGLERLGWRVAGKRIRLIVMSGEVSFSTRAPAEVEYLGWRSPEEVLRRLTECDLLYLPQPFEPVHRALAQLSFPTKLSAYASTGRPVLLHAPPEGSLAQFHRLHEAGSYCGELDPGRVAQRIQELAEIPALREAAARAVARIGEEVLSRETFRRQVKQFLDEPAPVQQVDLLSPVRPAGSQPADCIGGALPGASS